VFLSGHERPARWRPGMFPPTTLKEQMLVALDKVRAALDEAGSSMDHNRQDHHLPQGRQELRRDAANGVRVLAEIRAGLIEEPPASTFVMPASLARPSMLVEIDVIACLKD